MNTMHALFITGLRWRAIGVFFLISVHYLLFSSASAVAASPPEVLDFDIYLLEDRATAHTNNFGYHQFLTDNPRDPDWFTSIEDCDCYEGGRDPDLEENCQSWEVDSVCFCKTFAETHFTLYFRGDKPAGLSEHALPWLDYDFQIGIPGGNDSWSASFPRMILYKPYPGDYGLNRTYESSTEMATSFIATYAPGNRLRSVDNQVMMTAELRTSEVFPNRLCEQYTILRQDPWSIFASTSYYTSIVSTTLHQIAALKDFAPIELTNDASGETYTYKPIGFVEGVGTTATLKVRYGSPCAELAASQGLCGEIDLEKNLGDDSCDDGRFRGNPINITTGNKFQRVVDYSGVGALPLRWERNYNSSTGRWRSLAGIAHLPGSGHAKVHHANGRVVSWIKVGESWATDPDITSELLQLFDEQGEEAGWRHSQLDGLERRFSVEGRLLEVRHRAGYFQTYTYADNTLTITDSDQYKLIVSYDDLGRQASLTMPGGLVKNYQHDSIGRLVSVRSSNGLTETYLYTDVSSPWALTGIVNEKGVRYASWTYDEDGRAVSSEHAGGVDRTTVNYNYIESDLDPRVTVTNSLGKATTYHLLTQYGQRKIRAVEGHASSHCAAANQLYEYTNRGFKKAKVDWEGNRTEYLRDERGRILEQRDAVGTVEERLVTTEWHPTFDLPVMIDQAGLQTHYTYDNAGNLVGVERQTNSWIEGGSQDDLFQQ
ncbi:MAG: hypothetical protein ACI9GW_001157 [Halieaceae bacterium]|jgi:hypothetical protein